MIYFSNKTSLNNLFFIKTNRKSIYLNLYKLKQMLILQATNRTAKSSLKVTQEYTSGSVIRIN